MVGTRIKGKRGIYVNQTELAAHTTRSKYWLSVLNRCGVIKAVRKPGDDKCVYYHLAKTAAILDQLPRRGKRA